jgi:hypothetical protein
MARVLVSSVIDAPADQVWARIGDFNGTPAWLPFVAGSEIKNGLSANTVGCIREITQKDGLKFQEVLVSLSHVDRSCSYTFVGSPIPVKSHRTTIRLLPVTDGNRTYFEWSSQFDTDPDSEARLVPLMEQNFLAGARELRTQLETLPARRLTSSSAIS